MASSLPDLRLPSQPQGITASIIDPFERRPNRLREAYSSHIPLTGTKLYCLVRETHVCEQLAQGCYLKVERPGVEPATFRVASPAP